MWDTDKRYDSRRQDMKEEIKSIVEVKREPTFPGKCTLKGCGL